MCRLVIVFHVLRSDSRSCPQLGTSPAEQQRICTEMTAVKDENQKRRDEQTYVSENVIDPDSTLGIDRGSETTAVNVQTDRVRVDDRANERGEHAGCKERRRFRLNP